jgi:hypothetical protein
MSCAARTPRSSSCCAALLPKRKGCPSTLERCAGRADHRAAHRPTRARPWWLPPRRAPHHRSPRRLLGGRSASGVAYPCCNPTCWLAGDHRQGLRPVPSGRPVKIDPLGAGSPTNPRRGRSGKAFGRW